MRFKINRTYALIGFVLALFFFPSSSQADLSEFDVSNSVVDKGMFLSGGPKKDGIPAITEPQFVAAGDVDFLKNHDLVVGIELADEARAYPIQILNWHEIVNDKIADKSVAVTWCPLTRSAVAFDRSIKEEILEFGVSGLLFNSNVVMYDRTHNGLWSQLKMGGLTGKFSSENLTTIPSQVVTWKEWRTNHPATQVLSKKTGYWRAYDVDPYESYHGSPDTMFSIKSQDQRLAAKSLVVGIKMGETVKAYPLESINKLDGKTLEDKVNGQDITIRYFDGKTAVITDKHGNVLSSVVTYWFAWSTFHQKTLVYEG